MDDKLRFDEISKIDDDLERNEELYKFFDEDSRLKSRYGSVERITTLREIRKVLKADMKILDVGAATGVYTLPLAKEVKEVVAIEPSKNNYKKLLVNIEETGLENIKTHNVSSLDMGILPDDYFDIVLLFGPLYHLSNKRERAFTLDQAKRVCKKDGYIFIAFINHDMVPIIESTFNPNFFAESAYNKESQRIVNRPFIFFTLDECKDIINNANLSIEKIVATDGYSELLGSKIEEMSEEAYENYLEWHLSHCYNPELLGASNHFLFVSKKKKI